jgi:hypothetical protein
MPTKTEYSRTASKLSMHLGHTTPQDIFRNLCAEACRDAIRDTDTDTSFTLKLSSTDIVGVGDSLSLTKFFVTRLD